MKSFVIRWKDVTKEKRQEIADAFGVNVEELFDDFMAISTIDVEDEEDS